MSSNPGNPTPPAAAQKFDIALLMKLATDLPELGLLVQSAVSMAQAQKTAVTLLDHVKIAEPVLEQAAALGDKIIAQLKP